MRVDFYVIREPGEGARDRLCCRLTEKAWRMGHRVYVRAASDEHVARLDDLLWTFRDGSFVPHAALGAAHAAPDPVTPILIGNADADPPEGAEVLINLAPAAPGFFRRFGRIAEIVGAGEDERNAGRERFRFYREQALQPHTHEIG